MALANVACGGKLQITGIHTRGVGGGRRGSLKRNGVATFTLHLSLEAMVTSCNVPKPVQALSVAGAPTDETGRCNHLYKVALTCRQDNLCCSYLIFPPTVFR